MLKENKEKAILQAAEKLFAEKGFKGSTTTLIAAEAGVTHAMLHYYFRTKEQIFIRVLNLYIERLMNEFKAIMVTDEVHEVELFKKITETCFDFINKNRGHMVLLLEVAKDNPDILKAYESEFKCYMGGWTEAHKKRIDRAVKEKKIRPITFSELILDIISICSAPFFFEPAITKMTKMDDKQQKEFLEQRKKAAVEMIRCRIDPNRQAYDE